MWPNGSLGHALSGLGAACRQIEESCKLEWDLPTCSAIPMTNPLARKVLGPRIFSVGGILVLWRNSAVRPTCVARVQKSWAQPKPMLMFEGFEG